MASAFENRLRRTIEMAGTDGQAGPVPVMAIPSGSGAGKAVVGGIELLGDGGVEAQRDRARAALARGPAAVNTTATAAEGAWSADLATALQISTNLDKFRVRGGIPWGSDATAYKLKAATVGGNGNVGTSDGAYGVANSVELLVSGATSVMMKYFMSGSGAMYWQVYVDGAPLAPTPTAHGGTGARAVTVTLPNDGVQHRVRFETDQGTFPRVVSVNAGYVIAPQDLREQWLFFGDSFYNAGATRSPLQSIAWRVAHMLGVDAALSAVGGTGYVQNGGTNYTFADAQRLADMAMFAGKVSRVIISGGTNDGGGSISDISAAIDTVIANARAAHPGVPVDVTGCWNYNVGTPGKQLLIEQAIAERVALRADSLMRFVPVLTDPAGAWSTAGNIGTIIAADNTHPRAEIGEVYYSQKLARALVA